MIIEVCEQVLGELWRIENDVHSGGAMAGRPRSRRCASPAWRPGATILAASARSPWHNGRMDAARKITHFTEDEYLARERVSQTRHEYVNGEIFAMAGARLRHNSIAASIIGALLPLVRGQSCRVFNSDQRISVSATGMFTYPDAGVVCGKPSFHEKDGMSLLNPVVLVEVLSKSTEAYDRGEKLAHYRRNPSVREILIVWQSEVRVEHHRRLEGEDWLVREHREGAIDLPALGGAIALEDLYAQVDWTETEDAE